MHNAVNSPEDLKQAQIKRRFNRKDKVAAIRWIMGSPIGRSFIWWRLEEARIFSSTISEHHVMCALEGKRAMGLQLFELIQGDEECRELFREAQKENTRKEQANEDDE